MDICNRSKGIMKWLNVFGSVQVKFAFNFKFSCWLLFFGFVGNFICELLLSIYKITSCLKKRTTGDWCYQSTAKSICFFSFKFLLATDSASAVGGQSIPSNNLWKILLTCKPRTEFHSYPILQNGGVLCHITLCLWLNICHRKGRENCGVYIWHDQI